MRLSLAMTERIRTDYLMRREKRKESGEQERRRQRREQAAEAVVQAVTQPDEADDVERVRKLVRERLVEDEILDVQIDTLSPEEFLREVCRKIGRAAAARSGCRRAGTTSPRRRPPKASPIASPRRIGPWRRTSPTPAGLCRSHQNRTAAKRGAA